MSNVICSINPKEILLNLNTCAFINRIKKLVVIAKGDAKKEKLLHKQTKIINKRTKLDKGTAIKFDKINKVGNWLKWYNMRGVVNICAAIDVDIASQAKDNILFSGIKNWLINLLLSIKLPTAE